LLNKNSPLNSCLPVFSIKIASFIGHITISSLLPATRAPSYYVEPSHARCPLTPLYCFLGSSPPLTSYVIIQQADDVDDFGRGLLTLLTVGIRLSRSFL
jgi:hypothetical protein